MQALDIMTTDVVSVSPVTPSQEIAALLLSHGVSAVPVVDASGALVGMVSEGDLVNRDEQAREARRDWWLELLAEGQTLSPDFVTSLRAPQWKARDLMAAPVIVVSEATDVVEIARLLATHRIKRAPVVRDGRIVGIVSRADLLRAVAATPSSTAVAQIVSRSPERVVTATKANGAARLDEGANGPLRAADFRHLIDDFKHHEHQQQEAAHHAAAEERQRRVKELVDEHVSDEVWQKILHDARLVAQRGGKEFMMMRFPCQLCSDGGRAVNAPEPDWPKTLRGEAAEIYMRWQRDLKPAGFHLTSRVLDFPGGLPGDIGLFLSWGE